MVDARYDVTNPQAEVNSPGSQTYVQLVGYTLDGLGNRSQVQTTLWGGAPATTTYASDVVNQYTAVGGVTRTHDSNGNLTDDGTHQYLYDFKNRLVEVKLKSSGATVSTYRYDAQGRRVEKDVGGTVTRYILDGVTVVEEFDGTDTWQASYIHGDRIDHPCAMDRADIADVDGDSNTTEVLRFHYAQNALGSVSEMTAPSGAVVEWVTYDVYGLPTVRDQNGNVVASSAVGNPFLYTGREWDVEFEKYFYRARTYDPEAGRFLQRDPLGYVDGSGLYEYVSSAPPSSRDPSGLTPELDLLVRRAQAGLALMGAARESMFGTGGTFDQMVAAAKALDEATAALAAANAEASGAMSTLNALTAKLVALQAELQKEKAFGDRRMMCTLRYRDLLNELDELLEAIEAQQAKVADAIKAMEEAGAKVEAASDDFAAAAGAFESDWDSYQSASDMAKSAIDRMGERGTELGWAAAGLAINAVAAAKAVKFLKDASAMRHAARLPSMGTAGKGKGVREVGGSVRDARKLFDSLRGSNRATVRPNGAKTAPHPGGGHVTLRTTSRSGPPTVDVHGIVGGVRKIKFK